MTLFADTNQPRSASSRPERLVFLHLPKAAGTTLHTILDRHYGPDERFTIDGQRVQESIEAFKQLPASERARIRVLKGHMPFGLHHHLPGPAAYVTLLRDPVRRLISHYHYVRRHPAHYLHHQVIAGNMSLQDYVLSGLSVELENGQTRLLAGLGDGDSATGSGTSGSGMLDRAIGNLTGHFAVVGLVERFDETLILLHRAFGLRNVFYTRQNARGASPRRDELDQDTLAHILERNALDMALYQFACGWFAQQVRCQGRSFPVQVRLFRSLNWLYGSWWRLVHGISRDS
jgi:hypothetical protein